ncbi:MAG: hypothetical protein JSV89_10735 [Spirochaetaceae bacterium]|nr:MAG: hypothetical protein JSV89_10735 [Spirochaetaceae bacterium]
MTKFKEHLFEATLLALGKILSKYDNSSMSLLLKEVGNYIYEYLKKQGYPLPETGTEKDIYATIELFAHNGLAETLEVEQTDNGRKYTWHNLYGFQAYKELQEITHNPTISCPLNSVVRHLSGIGGRTRELNPVSFDENSRTAICIEQFVDKPGELPVQDRGLNHLTLENSQLLELAEERSNKLERILKELKILQGLLPICAHCKKIRDDQGYWQRIEQYLVNHSEAQFSHGLCPDCYEKLYPELDTEERDSGGVP